MHNGNSEGVEYQLRWHAGKAAWVITATTVTNGKRQGTPSLDDEREILCETLGPNADTRDNHPSMLWQNTEIQWSEKLPKNGNTLRKRISIASVAAPAPHPDEYDSNPTRVERVVVNLHEFKTRLGLAALRPESGHLRDSAAAAWNSQGLRNVVLFRYCQDVVDLVASELERTLRMKIPFEAREDLRNAAVASL